MYDILNALDDEDYVDESCRGPFVMRRLQDEEPPSASIFQFSSCAGRSINAFLPQLACTKRVDVPGFKLTLDNETRPEFFNPEVICRRELGPASSFCRSIYALGIPGCFDAVCSLGLLCQLPFEGSCRVIPVYERASCGNKKWCIQGQCVQDDRALATLGDDIPAYDNLNFPCDVRFCEAYSQFSAFNCPLTCSGIFSCPTN
ncbi:A disintegrin and metalloproteinase with thrombospondin motifs 7-like [Aplysia californica]|uniref:A disintegrin and metalloproteinase with thrombospondin motifs 7-like n=1 Tax=Aplysia californica TaxID=6500 RepID=A0ABM1VVZ4_APLCA|nr:A disintegrin and metalloproteinase with thrombospondin motifs 7-like [Aplysia californica]